MRRVGGRIGWSRKLAGLIDVAAAAAVAGAVVDMVDSWLLFACDV